MNFLFYLIFLPLFQTLSTSKKVIIYSTVIDADHLEFMSKIGTILQSEKYNVTLLLPIIDESVNIDNSLTNLIKNVIVIPKMAGNVCTNLFNNTNLLTHLKSENFEIGLAEPNYICSFALFEHLQIPKTISIDPSPTRNFFHPVPIKNGFLKRAQTLLETYFNYQKTHQKYGMELADLPIEVSDWQQLFGKVACFFVNSDAFLDFFGRFRTARIVEIGGIDVDFRENQRVEKNHKTQKRILINFDSYSTNLPLQINQSLTKVIESTPDFSYFFDENFDHSQIDLVVSSGSINILQNLAHNGLAAIIIPLSDEQLKNAQIFEKHGSSIIMSKKLNADRMLTIIQEILKNPKFQKNARLLSERIQHRPENPKNKFLAYFNYVAQYDLDLEHINLSFYQHYNLDIFAIFLITVGITVLVVKWLLVQFKTRKIKTM